MAKTNYAFEKRQRDIAKRKKKEEKLQKKLDKKAEKESGASEGGPPIDWNHNTPETGGEG